MRRLPGPLLTSLVLLLVLAPAALAKVDGGQGLYGEADDKVVTNAGFILVAAIPLFVATMSFIQWRLDKRKEARKAAQKARQMRPEWHGGW
jgi:hypothetical protein